MKLFNNTAILTSKNPEVFLNFTYDTGEYYILPAALSVPINTLYVNGLDINKYDYASIPAEDREEYALILDATLNVASFHVYTPLNSTFDTNLTFNFYNKSDASLTTVVESHDISILNRPYIIKEKTFNTLSNHNVLVNNEASYLVIRTNPKFTGNIKLVVDSSNDLYLDTFKVSALLGNKAYRKRSISANSVLSNDIRNHFNTLINTGELYAANEQENLNISIPKVDLENQYVTTYNYGSRILYDELYPEDNGILAPLWISSKLPDYFALFRIKGTHNHESYSYNVDLTDLANKYLINGDIIKSWSMRHDSNLGKYLNTHLQDILQISSPVFVSLSDPRDAKSESDPNTWYGIAVDKGVLTGRSEDPYFFNQKVNNFTDLNAFISDGFSRNNLLCPNLINLEFLFSDTDVSDYTMHRYFGLYLTENILYNVAYYSDSSSASASLISLDEKDPYELIDSSLFDISTGNIIENIKNRILVLNDGANLKRITNKNQLDVSIFNPYVSKPYKNIFSVEVQKNNTVNAFMTITINEKLEQGEHLRIINKTQNKIWEFYSIRNYHYHDCEVYCTVAEDDSYPTIYHTYFDINGNIKYQIKELKSAIERYSNYEEPLFTIGNYGENWLSIILTENANLTDEWVFQRIPATVLNNTDDISSGFNNQNVLPNVTFLGRFTPSHSEYSILNYDASFGPINFEFFGPRQSIEVPFILRNDSNFYSFNASNSDILNSFESTVLYQGKDLWYKRLLDFDISVNKYLYVKDPLGDENSYIIQTAEDINTVSNIFNAYSIYPLTISLMGINPVKDIDFNVYDSSSLKYQSGYSYRREDDSNTYKLSIEASSNYCLDIQGSYIIEQGNGIYLKNGNSVSYNPGTAFHTFDSSIYFESITDTIITYAILDSSYIYSGYSDSYNEEDVNSYFESNKKLKYNLLTPVVSKWVGLGNNCRSNPLLFRLDSSTVNSNTKSEYIPTDDSFSGEISYPSFKYLSPGTNAWKGYVFYDINDVDETTGLTIKELMFKYPYVDYFSKLMYSNYNVNDVNTRSSIMYYNGYKNSLDVICTGLNLSFKIQYNAKNLIDLKKYNRYRFSILSTASKNKSSKHPIEVIINENTKTVLMIWYQGNDELNYTYRHSSFLPGKSLLDPSDLSFVTGEDVSSYYSFIKAPFIINHSTIAKTMINLFESDDIFDPSVGSPYAQFNKALNGISSTFNAFAENTIIDNLFFAPYLYNTFIQKVLYNNNNYIPNSIAYNRYTTNYGYIYNTNKNLYADNTTDIKTLRFLLSSVSNVMFYLLRDDDIYSTYDFDSYNMMSISINEAREFNGTYAYNGWLSPKFNNLFEFAGNETDDIINIFKKDFTCSNTNLRLVRTIPQLWCNKLVSNITQVNIDEGNAITYVKDFDLFKSLWDRGYFIVDDTEINGYRCPIEMPAFFGSKLPKFPDKLEFNSWTSSAMSYSENDLEITINYNLSESIINKFTNNLTFVSNWSSLSSQDNIIIDYIKNTVFPYYSINAPKISLDLYYKPYDTTRIANSFNSSFILDEKQNINGQIIYRQNDYFYKIIIPKTGNYTYFVKITLHEK